jgi:hypothetical protein
LASEARILSREHRSITMPFGSLDRGFDGRTGIKNNRS